MKTHGLSMISILAAAVLLAGCSGGGGGITPPDNCPNADCQGGVGQDCNGATLTATRNGDALIMHGANVTTQVISGEPLWSLNAGCDGDAGSIGAVIIGLVLAPGTYVYDDDAGSNVATFIDWTQQIPTFYTTDGTHVGTITIEQVTATAVVGHFSLTVIGGPDPFTSVDTIECGRFEVPLVQE